MAGCLLQYARFARYAPHRVERDSLAAAGSDSHATFRVLVVRLRPFGATQAFANRGEHLPGDAGHVLQQGRELA